MEKNGNVIPADNNVIPVDINKEMKKSYIDYAMSVIVGRALPDVRDGLKPVHRRILYAMYEDNLTSDRPYRKCATTVGDVLGRYHPHGDASVYDALVRMAQDFSLRYPLIDGHGNFGSIDGDPPAAYRYTEARMSKISMEMLTDIEKETVDFMPNFDESRKEPVVLPSRFPNLLVGGSSGIAVGMATNIPPHNLGEVIDACIAMIDNPEIDVEGLMEYVKGPDFPTGGIVYGVSGIRAAYKTGRGKVIVRAKAEIEEHGNKEQIIVSEIPYVVNKKRLIEHIAELVKNKVIEGISDLNDESGRDGMRIVIEVKRDANASVVLNQLYKYTQMQDTFGVIMLAIHDGQPKVLNLRQIIEYYLDHQKDVIVRRTQFNLAKAEARAHILEGLKKALDNIDAIIKIIREAYNDAKIKLMEAFDFSEVQAQAILDMRLARLQGLEKEKIETELAELLEKIEYYKRVLADEALVMGIIKDEMLEIKNKYGDERRTEISTSDYDIDIEDLIPVEDNVITMTHFGYVKRQALDTYKSQRRGGRGISGMSTREEDFAENIFVANTHDYLMFFTNKARMHKIKAYKIPEVGRLAKGMALVNLLQLEEGERVTAIIPIKEFVDDNYLIMLTKYGVIKKTALGRYNSKIKGGLIAIKLDEGDELIDVKLTDGSKELIVGTHYGMAIRFDENDVRLVGRDARGVRAMKFRGDDYVVGMEVADEGKYLLTITEKGYGKRTEMDEYHLQSRGGLGVKNYSISDKTGNIIGIKAITDEDIMVITSAGIVIRTDSEEIRACGRASQGVKVIRADEENSVTAIAKIAKEEESDEEMATEIENSSTEEASSEE
ncbi:MAG: DNA gyrase subunit A [Clostridia bacterium]|nr:DNA gyrase subunit A [Clostridia bacterium]